MPKPRPNPLGIADQFISRWSSRRFSPEPVSAHQLTQLFEAARWSPSCFNEQPWFFLLPENEEQRARFLSLLTEQNQTWASKAPIICYLTARRYFRHNQKPNRHHAHDAGAACMALFLQAHAMGLSGHAMAGFDEARSYAVLGVDQDRYQVMSAIVLGKPSEEARQTEERTERKALDQVYGARLPDH